MTSFSPRQTENCSVNAEKPVETFLWICYNTLDNRNNMGLNTLLGGDRMKKKLSRLLRPGLLTCFIVMLGFCGAAIVMKQYYLDTEIH